MGFGPQFVDLDADGYADMISGDWLGQVILFRGQADRSFLAGEPVKGDNGEPIKIDYGVYSFAYDWDADGDLDLLAGTADASGDGNVYLLINEGTAETVRFGKPMKLLASGQEIIAPHGDAAPVLVDWDGDEKPDLIIGCGDGSVVYYRNVGSRHSPSFSKPETLVPGPQKDADRGVRAKVCVTDWNEDGTLDLLVGDHGTQFDKVLSEEEKSWRDEARERQDEYFAVWARAFQRYRVLLRKDVPNDADDAKRHKSALAEIRKELVQLNKLRNRYSEAEQSLEPGRQYHGRIWLYLGRQTTGVKK